ncbi:hypothetical protein HO173_010361 [Letharia columbiana]|uniref:Uncharacterized protein n=1 Tax=Letharia columbiana TaxID=112416 RepID=A0A8H6FMR6_9LECA|nr:uncharacterized protein HO173_010361 [Letharia columbiana]KAF6231401.1 hypothetical protein HO173_010361 [Letharia columbiana]
MVTCSSLYDAFLDNKALILTNIFRYKIDPSLMQDALTTLQSSRVTFRKREAAIDLVADYITLVDISKHVAEPTIGRGNRKARFVKDWSNQDLVNGCLSFGPAYLHRPRSRKDVQRTQPDSIRSAVHQWRFRPRFQRSKWRKMLDHSISHR